MYFTLIQSIIHRGDILLETDTIAVEFAHELQYCTNINKRSDPISYHSLHCI